jgi:hypothetical protein
MSASFCVVLSCVGRVLGMGRSPIQGSYQNVYIHSVRIEYLRYSRRGRFKSRSSGLGRHVV